MNVYIWEEIPPLNFTANTAGSTVKLNKNGTPASVTLETSTDGTNWVTYSFGTTITLTNIGDKVYFRNTSGTDTLFSTGGNNYYQFVMTGSINGGGDVTTLLNKSGTNVIPDWGLYLLFWWCTPLVTMPELPATEVGQYGYYMMFSGCTSLNDMKELPATTLGYRCYGEMFSQCSNLTYLPKLRITTLPDYCYYAMFSGCSKIKLSTTQTGEYQTAYRIPTSGTGSAQQYSIGNMFNSTGGTFTGTPSINTTYYTSNTLV